jgi:hypothetical protein
MASLRQLQHDLQQHLLGESSAITDAIVDAPPLPAAQRLGIYGNAYRVRLIDALGETYPVLHAVLGDEEFAACGAEFVAAHPSIHRSIRWYGAELAQFLAQHPPFCEQPIFAELALLEWTLAEVFDAADAAWVTRADLAALDPAAWSTLQLKFHPSLKRLQLCWNTVAVWRAMNREETPPDPVCAEPMAWLLWRQNFQNFFRSMTADEAAALDAARSGRTFGDICEILTAWLPAEEVPLRAAGLLGSWADSDLLVALSKASLAGQ